MMKSDFILIENLSDSCWKIFNLCVENYHMTDNVDSPKVNPFQEKNELDFILYEKCWIDCVQWHLEDIIRDPFIEPRKALEIKRRIDQSNQDRTNMVEQIDEYFYQYFRDVKPLPSAQINTETIAWAIDRLSILALKVYHMNMETLRNDSTEEHVIRCKQKLSILLLQKRDLCLAINQLVSDIQEGKKIIRLYKQMKMYNDPSLNPVLYNLNKKE